MASTAAIRENLSSHWEVSVTGRRAGAGGRPGAWAGVSSMVTSDISMNSSSCIFLTTHVGRDAAGLKRPSLVRGTGAVPVLGEVSPVEAEAAAARRSRPEAAAELGLNMGRDCRVVNWTAAPGEAMPGPVAQTDMGSDTCITPMGGPV